MILNYVLIIGVNMCKVRDSNIELLRILSMLGVVFLHYCNAEMGQGFKFVEDGSINQLILYLLQNICICAVNLFVLISGYFLCNTQQRSFIKVLELIFQVIFFNEFFYLFLVAIGRIGFTFNSFISNLFPSNYYVILYVTLYIISPYFNLIIIKLKEKQLNKLLLTLIILFSVYTILLDIINNVFGLSIIGLSTVSSIGSQSGYTIVNFVVMYFVGAYIKKNNSNYKTKNILSLLIVDVILLFTWSYIEHIFHRVTTTAWYYNNPLVILSATLIFLLFIKLDIKSKIINELAKGSFVCFLVHRHFLSHINIASAVTDSCWIMLLHIIIMIPLIYFISYIIYKVYNLCTTWFFKFIKPLVNKVNISL